MVNPTKIAKLVVAEVAKQPQRAETLIATAIRHALHDEVRHWKGVVSDVPGAVGVAAQLDARELALR